MRFPIKKKLYVAFGSVIALVFVLGGLTTYQLRAIGHFDNEARRYQEVELDAVRLAETMLKSRTHEKDFFARGGDEKNERLIHQRRDDFQNSTIEMHGDLVETDEEMARDLVASESQFADYTKVMTQAIAHFRARGTDKSGAQRDFREAAHRMEELAKDLQDPTLDLLIAEMRRSEKDFLLRGGEEHVREVQARADAIRSHADRALRPERAGRLRALTDDYQAKFMVAVDANEQLLATQAEIHATAERLHATLASLTERSHIEAEDRIARANQARTTAEGVLLGFFALTLALSIFVARFLARKLEISLGELTDATRAFAAGNLSRRVDIRSSDEVGVLGKSFNEMADSVQNLRDNIENAVTAINQVVNELQSSVSEQAASMQQQAASVSQTVATVDEISHSANHVADVAGEVMQGSSRSQEVASDGQGAVQDSVQGMQDVSEQVENIAKTILELTEKTHRIGGIITTVEDFASQSGMLALNASIEAARSGQDGKAFSVVASEVRKLAEQSRQATDEVRTILSEIQQATHTAVMVTEEGSKRVERGVGLVGKAGQIIAQLAESIERSADSAKQIAAASRQQSSGMSQITSAMSGIENFSKQNLEAMRQTETTSKSLAAVSQQLKGTLARNAA